MVIKVMEWIRVRDVINVRKGIRVRVGDQGDEGGWRGGSGIGGERGG